MSLRGVICGLSALVALAVPGGAHATVQSVEAFNNATVQPGGPRPGALGKAFFNMEGPDLGTFSSFGVADFQFAPFGFTVGNVDGLVLSLTQANAAFTANGTINFWLTTDTSANIEPGTSSLTYRATSPLDGVGSQLPTLFALGSGTFTQAADGTVDTFSLNPSAAAVAYLVGQLNAGGPIRLLVTPNTATVAATYAGFTNFNFDGPTLRLNATPGQTPAVPEPSSLALLIIGGSGIVGLAARQHQLRRPD